jgi:predicted phosphohydrolase
MTIWAIADLHASPLDESGQPVKSMDIFGANWLNHLQRLEDAWDRLVDVDDTVLVVGDTDWSLHLRDAIPTLERLGSWKGSKILVRGNHDYWWSSGATNKVRSVLPAGISLLHNNSFQVDGFNIVGCKGSPVPGAPEWTEVDAKLLNREVERFKLSLGSRERLLPTIAAVHYPPFFLHSGQSPYTELFERNGVVGCVYGHLHGEGAQSGAQGNHEGVRYWLVAGDNVDFRPVAIANNGELLVD